MPLREGTQTPDLLLRAIKKRWGVGVLSIICALLVTVFYTMGQKRVYRATATVLIDPNPPRPLGHDVQTIVDMGAGSYWANKEYYETQNKILQGRSIAEETVRQLGLQRDAAFIANLPAGTPVPASKKPIDIDIAAQAVMSRLKVDPVRDSRLVNVTFDDANPERARRILSALLSIYLQRNVDFAVSSTTAASDWLVGQVDRLKDDLESSELALNEFKKEKRILSVSLDDQSNMLRGEMSQLNDALTRIRARCQELRARVEQLDKVDPEHPTDLPVSELLSSPLLQSLRQGYIQAQSEYDSLLNSGKGDKHPGVESVASRVETTRAALVSEIRNVQGALRHELEAATRESAGVAGLFESAKQRALDVNILDIQYRRLERAKENNEKLYGLVLQRTKETELASSLRFNNIRVAEEPLAGRKPVHPRIPVNFAVGLSLGLLVGLGLMVGWESMDRKLRVPDEIEADLTIPLLGTLPSVDRSSKSHGAYYGRRHKQQQHPPDKSADKTNCVPELIVHLAPSSNTAEAARGIRTSLTFASPDKRQQVVLVTSANPGEGKTMVASTIAIAFAQAGHRTLLLDCDLRRARLHRVFQQTNDIGVSSAMYNPELLDSPTLNTTIPNLWLLPAGPRVASPAELLQSSKFSQFIASLRDRYDRIIVDSPPIIAVTDAVVLSTLSDATILVARSGKTLRQVALRAIRLLRDVSAPLLGCVLNRFEPGQRGKGYYYSYYHASEYSASSESST